MRTTKKSTVRIVRAGLIAALYVVLTHLANALGLASGVIQFRISEMLCILPIFLPEAIPALTVGCLISNLTTGCLPWDVVFGSLATLLGALGAYALRRVKLSWVATLPTIIANALIVPPVLLLVYQAEGSYLYFMITVAIGEIVCAGVLGTIFAEAIKKKGFLQIK
jgi:uncharacterized membrane protein